MIKKHPKILEKLLLVKEMNTLLIFNDDLSRKQEVDVDPKEVHQINFIGNLKS